MNLTKNQLRIVLMALEDAISDRESFSQAHHTNRICTVTGRIVPMVMKGYSGIVRRTQTALRNYKKLQKAVRQSLSEGQA